jgi:hypothetical protein
LLRGDTPLDIETGEGKWIKGAIENARSDTAILVMPDGVRFQISPRRSDELGPGVTWPGLHTQDWVIRSQIIPTVKQD